MSEYLKSLTDPTAIVGVIASVIVLVSMCFNTLTVKGERWMRVLNLVGSILSVIYGVMLGAQGFGMLLLNVPLVVVNIYYLVKSYRISDIKLVDSNTEINYNISDKERKTK